MLLVVKYTEKILTMAARYIIRVAHNTTHIINTSYINTVFYVVPR